jgi:hypothetical protein
MPVCLPRGQTGSGTVAFDEADDIHTIDLQGKGRRDREIVLEYERSIRQHVQDNCDRASALGFYDKGIRGLGQNVGSHSDIESLSAALGNVAAKTDPDCPPDRSATRKRKAS